MVDESIHMPPAKEQGERQHDLIERPIKNLHAWIF
jgi:hypothetical protein